jgi:hypothetical protein
MGIMNLHKRPSLSDEAISRFIDPRTGECLRPLGVVGGRTVWPMMGASPDDPADEGGDGGGSGDGDDPEGGGDDEGGDGSDKGDPKAKIDALNDEKNRHVKRRQEAEKERDALKAKLDELEGKDKSELEKVTARVTELESENKVLTTSLNDSRLENAFLLDNTYQWHNPRRALSLADLSDVEIDDDGTVHGLKEALKALAKSDAYLLKNKDEDEDDDKEEPVATTGSTGKSKRQKDKADAAQDALVKKYPALNR